MGGRIWRRLMVVEFVVKVRRKHARTRGLVVYDRHALDAAVTLAFAYGLDRRWLLPFLRRMLPNPDVHVYLDIDAETATARKPEDPMGHAAIVSQLALYARTLPLAGDVLVIDATRSIDDITADVWRALLDSLID